MMRIVCPICGEEPVKGQRHICRPAEAPAPRQQVELELPPRWQGSGDLGPGSCSAGSPPSDGSYPAASLQGTGGLGGLQRRTGLAAKPGAFCASLASLVSKSPGLWKSSKALAKTGGDEFVAGLFAFAVGFPGWNRDPKRVLITALTQRIADDAARLLQQNWRRILALRAAARPKPVAGVGGYLRLELPAGARAAVNGSDPAAASTSKVSGASSTVPAPRPLPAGLQPTPPRASSSERRPGRPASLERAIRRPPPLQGAPAATAPVATSFAQQPSAPSRPATSSAGSSACSMPPPSPRHPETPKNKSNPRPTAQKGVPMNPIQALKQRRLQQEQEAEERKRLEQQETEERQLRRDASRGSINGRSSWEDADAALPPPRPGFESPQSGGYQAAGFLPEESPGSCGSPPAALEDDLQSYACALAIPGSGTAANGDSDRQEPLEMTALTPLERRALRQAASPAPSPRGSMASRALEVTNTVAAVAPGSSTPRASSSRAGAGAAAAAAASPLTAATERLRERMKQRGEGNKTGGFGTRSAAAAAPAGEASTGAPPGAAARPNTGPTLGWQSRIEERQRADEECKAVEAEHQAKIAERTEKRADAMRRVWERRAQRQEEVEALDS
eukprot:TRINITY_DN110860_c0_g1_i1.p1 TRINITY_DN110860_c0_g1~~TRINITY_DN110860_c0_g1_i1.p1  ORF type:complete len:620 (+),score=173.19 TRINITY_DN110860_c0_g1_i1:64-1923(+)